MAKVLIKLDGWTDYLESRIGVDVYVYAANGETIITLMPKICELEKIDHTEKQAFTNTDRVLTLLQKRLLRGIDIFTIRGEDCSGLAVKYLLEMGIISSDMTANGLYEYTKKHGKEIALKDVRAGDYLFEGTSTRKTHVGYAVSSIYAVESKNHDEGVVKTVISERNWKYATRPDWYVVEPKKPILKRELKLTDPYMRGEDVRETQLLLQAHGYNPGTIDGIFGKNTEIASKNFKHDNGLNDKTGTIGKKTAEKLGFDWSEVGNEANENS